MAKILIAKNGEAIREFVIRSLNEDGHELRSAIDSAAALDAMNRRGNKFDFLLSDVKMPIMDGIASSPGATILTPRSC
jgi:two-component system, cell cycle response regulator CpdR